MTTAEDRVRRAQQAVVDAPMDRNSASARAVRKAAKKQLAEQMDGGESKTPVSFSKSLKSG